MQIEMRWLESHEPKEHSITIHGKAIDRFLTLQYRPVVSPGDNETQGIAVDRNWIDVPVVWEKK